MTRVLVLDAHQRSALAVTRALGSRGIDVLCADLMTPTLAGASRYCVETFAYPSPADDPEAFVDELAKQTQARQVDVLFPMTEATVALILANQQRFQHVRIPFRNPEAFFQLSDKGRLMVLAAHLGVRVPNTRIVSDSMQTLTLAKEIGYPLVVKLARTPIPLLRYPFREKVYYARDPHELSSVIDENPHFRECHFLLQERVRGTGAGVFTVYHEGQPVVFFAHRRLREKPPSGGVSVLSESCQADPGLVQVSKRILDHVGWDGVAMVEFKVTPEGVPYLMEVNARYWGSLQLAIDAGVDFPFLQFQSVMGELPRHDGTYRVGIRNRWLLGDLDHLYLRLKNHTDVHPDLPSVGRAIWDFMQFFARKTYYDVNRWGDLRPFCVELTAWAKNSLRNFFGC
ncbi:MAG: ATP-grasp domain-containing protein [Gammaproteobacteria bacterium]|nr:ATP-grasp domain-containing protein [Gammaproteobacteria bacterium]MCI0591045.1 ATP-grasp domain-containing protein [Gammaproteobacteria bacterium]